MTLRTYPSDYAVSAYYNTLTRDVESLDTKAEAYINGAGQNVYQSFCYYAWQLIMAGHRRIGGSAACTSAKGFS